MEGLTKLVFLIISRGRWGDTVRWMKSMNHGFNIHATGFIITNEEETEWIWYYNFEGIAQNKILLLIYQLLSRGQRRRRCSEYKTVSNCFLNFTLVEYTILLILIYWKNIFIFQFPDDLTVNWPVPTVGDQHNFIESATSSFVVFVCPASTHCNE